MWSPQQVDAVVFDCDGVLVDSEVICQVVEREALVALGLELDAAAFRQRFLGMATHQILQLAAAETGFELDPSRVHAVHHEIERRMAQVEPVPGALEAVRATRGPKAVASNSNRSALVHKLQRTGLAGFFGPHVHSRNEVALPKPAPDLFLRAAAMLGVSPNRLLVIEDSVPGVRAAVAAGAAVLGFVGGSHQDVHGGRDLVQAGAQGILEGWAQYTDLARRQ